MNRRGAFATFALGLAGLFAPQALAAGERVGRVVYHVSDEEKVGFALGNVRNHLDGAEGPITLAVVVHGPALQAFRRAHFDPGLKNAFRDATARGVRFHACARTMKGMNLALEDLEPGFSAAERGGVVLLADLQAQGWAYIRP